MPQRENGASMEEEEETQPSAAGRRSRIIFWISAPEASQMLAAIEARSRGGDVCVVVSPLVEQRAEGLGLRFEEDLDKVLRAVRQQMAAPEFAPQFKSWLEALRSEQNNRLQNISAVVGPLGELAKLLTPVLTHPAAKDSIGEVWASFRRHEAVNRNIDDACRLLRESAQENLDVAARKAFLALTNTDETEAREGDVAAAWRVVAFALHSLIRGNADERKTLRLVHRQITSGDIPKASAVLFTAAAIEAFHLKEEETLRAGTIAALKAALSSQDESFRNLDEAKIRATLSTAVPVERGERRGRKGGAVRHGPARVVAELALHAGALGCEQRAGETQPSAIVRLTNEFDQATRRMKKRFEHDARK